MTFISKNWRVFIFCMLFHHLSSWNKVYGQQHINDSLHHQLYKAKTGIDSIQLLSKIAEYSTKDSGIYYFNLAIAIAERLGDEKKIADLNAEMGFYLRSSGDYAASIKLGQNIIKTAEVKHDTLGLLKGNMILIFCYSDIEDSTNRRFYSQKSLEIYETGFINRITDNDLKLSHEFIYNNYKVGSLTRLGKIDSAIHQARLNLEKAKRLNDKQWIGITAMALASRLKGDERLPLLQESWQASLDIGRYDNAAMILLRISEYYKNKGQTDSALYYSKRSLNIANIGGVSYMKLNAYHKLFELYKPITKDSAYQYLEKWALLNDSLYGKEVINKIQSLNINERSRLDAEANNRLINEQRKSASNRFLFLLVASFLLLAIAGFYYQNNKNRKKSHQKLEIAYHELKTTQKQLIQSEKMASLGELTAGIAHEIQNPLNFVNNFSEVNNELIEELKGELAVGNLQLANELADDIKFNQEKINHHGKRADAIVKSMLQHSRSSNGVKEPTDINALCDEYLRLSYHGLRAKDKSFNATLKTDFDNTIGNINIIPHDIGRVILNLITNAFYAVDEKKKTGPDGYRDEGYEPTVTITTASIQPPSGGRGITIIVSDNGGGIPQKVLDKIFQPFFTTKPTGQGTGLGLSLSYDIVKAHGGEIKVNTNENEGTEFIIRLPV